MPALAPSLAPIFRSQRQLVLLGELFVTSPGPLSMAELVRRTGVQQSTISREIARLARSGIVTVRALGRNRLVEANPALPWYRELRALLAQTIGCLPLLGEALTPIPGIRAAFIFGSWAARYLGERGPFPRDVDLLVVGDPDVATVHRACQAAESRLRVGVNPLIVSDGDWAAAVEGLAFLAQLRLGPLVPLTLAAEPST